MQGSHTPQVTPSYKMLLDEAHDICFTVQFCLVCAFAHLQVLKVSVVRLTNGSAIIGCFVVRVSATFSTFQEQF